MRILGPSVTQLSDHKDRHYLTPLHEALIIKEINELDGEAVVLRRIEQIAQIGKIILAG